MPKTIFINLPVTNLAASTRFYEALGFRRNPLFSDHRACSMIWSDAITIQLLSRDFFGSFSTKPVADAHASCQVMLCLTRDSRAEVDALAAAAAKAGGKVDARAPMDGEFLYNREFEDPDGHVFEAAWVNPDMVMSRQQRAG
jgi:uncharacterized protein